MWNNIWGIGNQEMVLHGELPGWRLIGRLFKRLERKGTNFCEQSRSGRWLEESRESERMWSRRLQFHGGLKTRGGILNWMYMRGIDWGCMEEWDVVFQHHKCEEMDRALVHRHWCTVLGKGMSSSWCRGEEAWSVASACDEALLSLFLSHQQDLP